MKHINSKAPHKNTYACIVLYITYYYTYNVFLFEKGSNSNYNLFILNENMQQRVGSTFAHCDYNLQE